jgi:hypothetical protein
MLYLKSTAMLNIKNTKNPAQWRARTAGQLCGAGELRIDQRGRAASVRPVMIKSSRSPWP